MNLRHRGYLAHLESPNSIYFVTFRLVGSVPKVVLDNWRFEREEIQQNVERQKRQLTALRYFDGKRYRFQWPWTGCSERIEKLLDG